MFLGYVPDFLGAELTPETLDPMEVHAHHIMEGFRHMAASFDKNLSQDEEALTQALIEAFIGETSPESDFANPERKLRALQSVFARLAPRLERVLGMRT
jgi:hypothetical protein